MEEVRCFVKNRGILKEKVNRLVWLSCDISVALGCPSIKRCIKTKMKYVVLEDSISMIDRKWRLNSFIFFYEWYYSWVKIYRDGQTFCLNEIMNVLINV